MTRSLAAVAALALFACNPVDMEFDLDEDGLLEFEENDLGLDPDNPDSDNDGYLDGDELDLGTDPSDGSFHPYKGGWSIDGDCRSRELSSSSAPYNVGDLVANHAMVTQFGDEVKLHDFCGKHIVVKYGAFWCGPCKSGSQSLNADFGGFSEDDVIVVEFWSETAEGGTPGADYLMSWANQYDLTNPEVVAFDHEGTNVGQLFEKDGGIPSYSLIGPGGEVLVTDNKNAVMQTLSSLGN